MNRYGLIDAPMMPTAMYQYRATSCEGREGRRADPTAPHCGCSFHAPTANTSDTRPNIAVPCSIRVNVPRQSSSHPTNATGMAHH